MKIFHALVESVKKTHITEGQHKGWILFTLIFTISEEGIDTRKYSTSFVTSQIGCLFHKLYHVGRIECGKYEVLDSGGLFKKQLILI